MHRNDPALARENAALASKLMIADRALSDAARRVRDAEQRAAKLEANLRRAETDLRRTTTDLRRAETALRLKAAFEVRVHLDVFRAIESTGCAMTFRPDLMPTLASVQDTVAAAALERRAASSAATLPKPARLPAETLAAVTAATSCLKL